MYDGSRSVGNERNKTIMKNALSSCLCSTPCRRFVLFGGLYVALWLATWYSAGLLDRLGVVSLWFLPAGLRFACLLVFGRRGLVLELIVQLVFALMQVASIAGAPIVDLLSEQTLWRLYNLFASLLGNAVVIFALRRGMKKPLDFTSPRHSALFFTVALLVSAWSASAGTCGLIGMGYIESAETGKVLTSWLIGDFIGIITLAPFLLVRVVPGLQHFLLVGRWSNPRKPGIADDFADRNTVLMMILALFIVFVLPWPLDLNQHFPLIALLLLLPLAGVALHYSLRVTVLAVMLLDAGLVILIAVFGHQDLAMQYQVVMISIALVGLLLGGAVEARNHLMSRYRDFASVSNDLLWEVDHEGRLIEASGQLAVPGAFSPGISWQSILGADAASQRPELEAALTAHQAFRHLEFTLPGAHGTPRWIQINGLPLFDNLGRLLGYRGTAVDVSVARQAESVLRTYNDRLRDDVQTRTRELRESNEELASKQRHLQVLLAAAPVGVLELDASQNCRYLNANACRLTGYSAEQASGLNFLDFVHPDNREYVSFVWQNIRQSEDVQFLEFRLDRTNLRCAAHWIKLNKADQPLDGTVMVLTNATARSQQDERLWTLAHHDTLTDLPNRNLFWDRAGQALRHAHRHGSGAAVLWIDLDGFKAVNDRWGHATGDKVLQQVALRLKKRVRDSDTVARMGGDEFAVVMPDIGDPAQAMEIARQLVTALADPFDLATEHVVLSGSIGIALYPQHADTAEALTQCADMAMYSAKHAGKNQVQMWSGL